MTKRKLLLATVALLLGIFALSDAIAGTNNRDVAWYTKQILVTVCGKRPYIAETSVLEIEGVWMTLDGVYCLRTEDDTLVFLVCQLELPICTTQLDNGNNPEASARIVGVLRQLEREANIRSL